MTLNTKRIIIAGLGIAFVVSLLLVQWLEIERKAVESGRAKEPIVVPGASQHCVECHSQSSPGIVDHWKASTHAKKGVGCVECHQADSRDADAFSHYGSTIAIVVTPRDCSRCHVNEAAEFERSHHSKAGNILASLDNHLAETVEGSRLPFDPHSPTPGKAPTQVNGMAAAFSGCHQCHGSKVGLRSTDGGMITVDDLKPDKDGRPTSLQAVARIAKSVDGRPLFHAGTWPNTGVGRLNLDGTRGSCAACHSRHDFSPRRGRQPENCGKCHLGPDHPQKEIYEESKHGVAYRDLRDAMNLDAKKWVLGRDYSQAPTCATCHMSGNLRNGGKVTHDPGERISWTNRPPISLVMDTDTEHRVVTATEPEERVKLTADSAEAKRTRMRDVCQHCHTPDYVTGFYKQYDDFVILYNEKFAKPGQAIIGALRANELLTKLEFDEKIEWTWFYLWHHEGRRARHGASMMAPDYVQWHGMYEVAERFYTELIPEARELAREAAAHGNQKAAAAVTRVIDDILARPEHAWFSANKPSVAPPPTGTR